MATTPTAINILVDTTMTSYSLAGIFAEGYTLAVYNQSMSISGQDLLFPPMSVGTYLVTYYLTSPSAGTPSPGQINMHVIDIHGMPIEYDESTKEIVTSDSGLLIIYGSQGPSNTVGVNGYNVSGFIESVENKIIAKLLGHGQIDITLIDHHGARYDLSIMKNSFVIDDLVITAQAMTITSYPLPHANDFRIYGTPGGGYSYNINDMDAIISVVSGPYRLDISALLQSGTKTIYYQALNSNLHWSQWAMITINFTPYVPIMPPIVTPPPPLSLSITVPTQSTSVYEITPARDYSISLDIEPINPVILANALVSLNGTTLTIITNNTAGSFLMYYRVTENGQFSDRSPITITTFRPPPKRLRMRISSPQPSGMMLFILGLSFAFFAIILVKSMRK